MEDQGIVTRDKMVQLHFYVAILKSVTYLQQNICSLHTRGEKSKADISTVAVARRLKWTSDCNVPGGYHLHKRPLFFLVLPLFILFIELTNFCQQFFFW